MVYFINPYHLFSGSVFSKSRQQMNLMKEAEQAPNNDNIPVPNGNQDITNYPKMTAITDNPDVMNEVNQMDGGGFMVKGAGIRKIRNDKLKKFITLNV